MMFEHDAYPNWQLDSETDDKPSPVGGFGDKLRTYACITTKIEEQTVRMAIKALLDVFGLCPRIAAGKSRMAWPSTFWSNFYVPSLYSLAYFHVFCWWCDVFPNLSLYETWIDPGLPRPSLQHPGRFRVIFVSWRFPKMEVTENHSDH